MSEGTSKGAGAGTGAEVSMSMAVGVEAGMGTETAMGTGPGARTGLGDYTNTADVVVKNGFFSTVNSITLRHKYSSDPEQSKTWNNVAAGATTSPPLSAGYNTGFIRYGMDYWHVEVVFADGVVWSNSGWKECYLEAKDDKSKGQLVFEVSPTTFSLNMRSDGCTTSMSGNNGYNGVAFVKMENKFPVATTIKLTHQYSSKPVQEYTWNRIPAGTTTPDYFSVYFNTGFGTGFDYWNVQVTLDVPPPDNLPAQAFVPFRNAKSNKECMLQDADKGKELTFSVGGDKFYINMPSGGCTDDWVTSNGYNTAAFLKIRNDFDVPIRSAILTHQYSTTPVCTFTRSAIATGGFSDPLIMVEYNVGAFTGWDYWNVTVFLDDGRTYQNGKKDKECYLTAKDTKSVLTFSVSKDNFHLGLDSGACNDGMKFSGQADYNLGRDNTRRYSENAYLASHNAFANFADGFYYAQQSMDIESQMAYGATTLLLDIWDYNNDVYLLHEYSKFYAYAINPFGRYIPLLEALNKVRDFMTRVPDAIITIVFEDRVQQANRSKIKDAFVAAGLWDQVFFADKTNKGWNVGQQGWPTLQWMIDNNLRLVVFSSTANPFPRQWSYMSENVYGNKSLDPATYLNPRGESQSLDKLALCALNRFPDFNIEGIWLLPAWIGTMAVINQRTNLVNMVDACRTRWGRLPNYINLDFVEVPTGETAAAVKVLNDKLHGKTPRPVQMLSRFVMASVEPASPISSDDLVKQWQQLASVADGHLNVQLRHLLGNSESQGQSDGGHAGKGEGERAGEREGNGEVEQGGKREGGEVRADESLLRDVGNMALVLYGLLAPFKDPAAAGEPVRHWAQEQALELAARLGSIDARLGWVDWQGLVERARRDPLESLWVAPFLVIRELTGQSFPGLEKALVLSTDEQYIRGAIEHGHPDLLLTLDFLGVAEGTSKLHTLLAERVKSIASGIPGSGGADSIGALQATQAHGSQEGSPGEPDPQSAQQDGEMSITDAYSLAHEVFYATRFGRRRYDADDLSLSAGEMVEPLRRRLSDLITHSVEHRQLEVVGELLAAYWYVGGGVSDTVLYAVERLHAELPAGSDLSGLLVMGTGASGRDKQRDKQMEQEQGELERGRQEQEGQERQHMLLTWVLGLGVTLSAYGDSLWSNQA